MPSIDEELLLRLFDSGIPFILAEQNNGYIWQNFLKALYRAGRKVSGGDLMRVIAINTLDDQLRPRFIHSGNYEELTAAFDLSAPQLTRAVMAAVGGQR